MSVDSMTYMLEVFLQDAICSQQEQRRVAIPSNLDWVGNRQPQRQILVLVMSKARDKAFRALFNEPESHLHTPHR